MEIKTGVCEHCGQHMALEVPDGWTQEQTDRDATYKCDCPAATAERVVEDMVDKAVDTISKFFEGKGLDTTEKLLLAAVEPMARKAFKKLTISNDGTTVQMKRLNNGISVQIKEVLTEGVES